MSTNKSGEICDTFLFRGFSEYVQYVWFNMKTSDILEYNHTPWFGCQSFDIHCYQNTAFVFT